MSEALCRLLQALPGLGSSQLADAGFHSLMQAYAGFCRLLQTSAGISDIASLCGLMQADAAF
jgi:hypothetical protein